MNVRWLFFGLTLLFLAGCGAPAGDGGASPPEIAQATLAATTAAPPTATATLPPTATPTPTATSTPTAAPTATPTTHPMDVQVMRAQEYPGSPITIVEELTPGSNYRRYYAYYLSDGLKIYGLLTVPNGDPPPGGWPALVFNHGYIPPTVYKTTERYVAYVDLLARSGYIVYKIDYRGHDQSEGAPTGAYGSPGYTHDVLNAVSSLAQFPGANTEKIGMWGHSMGGYLTLRSMVISPQIKAGVIWAGVVGSYPDLLNNWRRRTSAPTPPPGARRWRQEWVELYGSPEENPQFWAAISANSYLADLNGPLQLHHGTADADVPVEFSTTLAGQMEAAGKPVELHIYEGDDHNLSNYFNLAMQRTIAFFDQHLKGEPPQ